ncbi:polysaccharide pyruvyl transferase family protein [Holdemanella biformis]|uniref:polysaccharide pyruvyl transferase family protein n=1 Tax=Holdemanella biformis TaxID=1735 RepID=UPI003AB13058|nr:polysaccharide pyruvyl transferase family protein [Holdemanella biformis]
MKIGLIGFEFESANKGCEALVYSFLSLFNQLVTKDVTVYNFSGTNIGMVSNYFSDYKFINILPRLKDVNMKYFRALRSCDYIFDVTMGDSFSDIYSKDYYFHLIKQKVYAELIGKKYILLPQTYGPFEYAESEKKAKKVFNRAYKIYCRDEMSQKLLEEKFGIKNSVLVSDMAFILPFNKTKYKFSNKEKIGINISGLLYKGGFHSENQFGLSLNYPELINKLINELSDKYEVHLIPHVIDLKEDAYDDDYKICELLNEKYPNTILAPAFDTPIEAKSYISNMDVFVGSRMHSTIASFSAGVVTIPISYSRKFEGLFGSLNYPYVVNAKEETTDSAYELVVNFIKDRSKLAGVQKESMTIIQEKNRRFKESIRELLKEK